MLVACTRTCTPVCLARARSGWINDPNAPLLHKGTYHVFYQHSPG